MSRKRYKPEHVIMMHRGNAAMMMKKPALTSQAMRPRCTLEPTDWAI